MFYSITNREDLGKLEELVSLKNQVEEVRLQDTLGQQSFHENIEKVFEPVTDTIKNTFENLTKTLSESATENNQALENLTGKVSKIMNYRGIIATYLLSPLSKISNPESTSQFKLIRHYTSNRVNDLLIHNTKPVTLYNRLLAFRENDK